MIERFFETIELPITIEQFHKLPYNAAYKYEYFGDRAWLTPRTTNNVLPHPPVPTG